MQICPPEYRPVPINADLFQQMQTWPHKCRPTPMNADLLQITPNCPMNTDLSVWTQTISVLRAHSLTYKRKLPVEQWARVAARSCETSDTCFPLLAASAVEHSHSPIYTGLSLCAVLQVPSVRSAVLQQWFLVSLCWCWQLLLLVLQPVQCYLSCMVSDVTKTKFSFLDRGSPITGHWTAS